MKRLFLSLILSLFVLVSYAEGISNYKELLAFAKAVNKEADISQWQNDKGVVCLKADIDMKKGKKFPTIKKFEGKFDGCGFRFYNWEAKSSLFHTLTAKAVVQNIIIDPTCRLEVKTSYNEENELVAFIAKVNRGYIINCTSYGTIEHTGEEALKAIYIGSIAALNYNVVHKCKNAGGVSSRINFTHHAKGMSLRMGGLIGSCYGKAASGATISYCENTGSISYMGDYPNNNIGGIAGETHKLTVKYCVNRGNVVAVGTPISTPKVKGYSRAGGIAGWSNNDILCCDNMGVVAVSGAHEANAAGICARPNATFNMVDCNNYAKISANTSMPAFVGGIFGQCTRDIHVSNCYNYGEVLSEGVERQGWCGGIGGAITTSKGMKVGAFVRDCMNYGAVTNKSKHASSATGGVLGYGSGLAAKKMPVVYVNVCDCGNAGKITSADQRTNEIVGYVKLLELKGQRYEDVARMVKPLPSGENVIGRIVDNSGMPIEGVVVSDGEQSVQTNVNGEYQMKSNLSKARFVIVSVPAEYEIPLRDNRPQFFRRIPRYAQAVRADFVLTKRVNPSDNFVLAMIGDPQTRGLLKDKSTERFRDIILPDVAELKSQVKKDVYAINLGDLVYNWMFAYDDYVDVLAQSSVPMISVIGNHDCDQRNLFETKLGTPYFESYLAPQNYSFNIGKIHFVVVNDILYNRPTDKHKYKVGLEGFTYKWLENDLKFVPKESTIVICSHAPLFKGRGAKNFAEKRVNYKKYAALLSQYKKVYAWAGHTHQNYSFDYEQATGKFASLKNIESIIVARCIGMIRLNRELNNDGTPNGYMVAEVNGDSMEWYYKTVGHDRDYQMRVYTPAQSNSEYVKVNIWNHSPESWSNPEWWENGVKVADMETTGKEHDPAYLKIYAEHNEEKLDKTERKYSQPAKVPFLFRVKPTQGVHAGEVRVTDQFGRTYVQAVEW